MDITAIQANLCAVRERMAAACRRAGRAPQEVRLIAVSKTVSADVIRLAYEAGQRCFGENRVQDLRQKVASLPADCEWHLIGHLQSNKARTAIDAAAWLQAIDSAALLHRLDQIAAQENRRPLILLQVNVSGESTKSGAAMAEAAALVAAARQCLHVECRGLMTMAPYGAPEAELRGIFGGLRRLRDQLQAESGQPLPELSMGMSGDFEIAIEEGATLVRVGTALFGERQYPVASA